jgi:hypothetical protein
MRTIVSRAELFLNGEKVGTVNVRGWESSWGIGDFEPDDAFSPFAPVFGEWAMLMHEDADARLSPAASEELNAAERAMDSIRARLFFPDRNEWRDVRQINIDAELIEWKE